MDVTYGLFENAFGQDLCVLQEVFYNYICFQYKATKLFKHPTTNLSFYMHHMYFQNERITSYHQLQIHVIAKHSDDKL